MARKYRKFSIEFKDEAVRMLISGRSPTELSSELGIHPNLLYKWKEKYMSEPERSKDKSFEGKTANELYQELKETRKQLARMTEQREILKKTVEIFGSEK